ncbi:speckle-type POZ protein-like B [Aphidius gifuensis]|uniref:speckle-type POZ protein-like B n=1 Tax=Aphidius gifuensis TaxID=684658 RepID=UPI001CDD15D1|nr:speckle-type POZ protein-like B [Aphidius gifuensis]
MSVPAGLTQNFIRLVTSQQAQDYVTDLLKPINGHLQNDELKIYCTITMSKKLTKKTNVISTLDHARQQLSVNWKKLLLSGQSADVTILMGQKSFPAIKGILAVRSPVFAAMFNHEQLKENQKNEVVIEDIDEDVFEEFLHFIYTGESPNINKMPMKLLAVAEKYQVDCLKNICEEILCETINSENVESILVFSDKYSLKKLDEECFKFMKKNFRGVLSKKTLLNYRQKYPQVFLRVPEELLSAKPVNF